MFWKIQSFDSFRFLERSLNPFPETLFLIAFTVARKWLSAKVCLSVRLLSIMVQPHLKHLIYNWRSLANLLYGNEMSFLSHVTLEPAAENHLILTSLEGNRKTSYICMHFSPCTAVCSCCNNQESGNPMPDCQTKEM